MKRKEAVELGLKFYNTGKECKYGHLSDRRTTTAQCKECMQAAGRDYRWNSEKRKEWYKKYRKRPAVMKKAREAQALRRQDPEYLAYLSKQSQIINAERKKNDPWYKEYLQIYNLIAWAKSDNKPEKLEEYRIRLALHNAAKPKK